MQNIRIVKYFFVKTHRVIYSGRTYNTGRCSREVGNVQIFALGDGPVGHDWCGGCAGRGAQGYHFINKLDASATKAYVAKDVVADILPPPMYLIEMRLVLSMMLDAASAPQTAKAV